MSRIPDFAAVDFAAVPAPASSSGEPWLTPEGIAVKSAYMAADRQGLGNELDVFNEAHVQHAIGLVQHQRFHRRQHCLARLHVIHQSAGCGN